MQFSDHPQSKQIKQLSLHYRLRQMPLFSHLPDEQLGSLCGATKLQHYSEGEVILRAGVRGGFLGIVKSGQVVAERPGSKKVPVAVFRRGDWFGQATLLQDIPSSVTLRTTVPTSIYVLHKSELKCLPEPWGTAVQTMDVTSLARVENEPFTKTANVDNRFLLMISTTILIFLLFFCALSSSPGLALLRKAEGQFHYILGSRHLNRGNAGEAFLEFEQAVTSDSRYPPAYTNLGYLYFQQGKLQEARAVLQEAAELCPTCCVVHNNLGIVYWVQRQLTSSIPEFQMAIEHCPNDAQLRADLGLVYYAQGNFDKAIGELRQAILIDPSRATLHSNLGVSYYKSGDLDSATSEFSEALKLDPMLPTAHCGLGAVYLDQGDADSATKELQRAVALDPIYSTAYFYLGQASELAGDYSAAIKAFRKALVLGLDPEGQRWIEQRVRELVDVERFKSSGRR